METEELKVTELEDTVSNTTIYKWLNGTVQLVVFLDKKRGLCYG